MEENKKIEVVNKCKETIRCDFALNHIEEDGLFINVFTEAPSAEDKRVIENTSKLFIPKEVMLRFAYDIVVALREYEQKFENGFGLDSKENIGDNNG